MQSVQRADVKKRTLMRGLENLSDLGGFISEEIEDRIYELYPSEVVSKTLAYCPLGPGIWDVLSAVEKAQESIDDVIEERLYDESEDYSGDSETEAYEWMIDQIARLETERVRSGKKFFWQNWELSRETKRALKELNALETRVLALSKGVDSEEKLDAGQIAKLSEFQCREEFIVKVLEMIKHKIRYPGWSNVESSQACDAHRSM